MDLEEKSREYADKKLQTCLSQIIPENSDNDEEIMFARHVERYDSYDIEQAYEDGYNEALNSQWKDPKVELPEEDEWVDVCICRYDGSIKYRFEARHKGDGVFVDEDGFKHDCISYWMRVPDPMPKGGAA